MRRNTGFADFLVEFACSKTASWDRRSRVCCGDRIIGNTPSLHLLADIAGGWGINGLFSIFWLGFGIWNACFLS